MASLNAQFTRAHNIESYLKGYATSFGTPNPANGSPEYTVFGGSSQNPQLQALASTTDPEALRNYKNGRSTLERRLARVNEAMCYLVEAGGKLDGSAETVRLEQRDACWYLVVTSACAKSGTLLASNSCEIAKNVTAAARCYLYDQS